MCYGEESVNNMKDYVADIKRVLVIGDAMLDIYHFGQVDRISPEAPVPVFLESEGRRCVPGGAANVAVNLAAIGLEVSFCAIVGDDRNGQEFLELMEENHIDTELVKMSGERKTITKSRYIGQGNQQILRVDDEDIGDVSLDEIKSIMDQVESRMDQYGIVVLSDYKKGFLTREITRQLITIADSKKVPVLADVKDTEFTKYGLSTVLKPNRKELELLTGMDVRTKDKVLEAAKYLCREAPCRFVLVTLGAEGMLLADEKGLIQEIESAANEVFDVTGAGDTSIAYLAAEMAMGKEIREAMVIANYAAGIQVSKVGTSVVYPYEVYDAMRRAGLSYGTESDGYGLSDKISSICKRKERGDKIVFTNGCFDILHTGHVTYLQEARKMGDVLVVGLNSDDSVRRLKGEERPINCLEDREIMLSALSSVDYVIPFEEDTPIRLIERIRPDILVKGGDYEPKNIVGSEVVLKSGGRVEVIPFVEGHSTTEIIGKIQNK